MLAIRNLSAYYGMFQALSAVDLDVPQGEIVSLLGANGAGKSTLLKAIAGLLRTRGGSIHLDGQRIDHLEPHEIVERGVSLVPEGRRIFSSLTVLENLLIGSYPSKARPARKEALETVFNLFPCLKERRNVTGTKLSGGEQQMLAIARALMSRPRLVIFDEISLGLSPAVIKMLYQTVRRINEEGVTILLVEQDLARSLETASRAYILQEGRVSLQGDPAGFTEAEVKRAYFGI